MKIILIVKQNMSNVCMYVKKGKYANENYWNTLRIYKFSEDLIEKLFFFSSTCSSTLNVQIQPSTLYVLHLFKDANPIKIQ